LLASNETRDATPPSLLERRRLWPKYPNYGIPVELRPTVVQRVVEQKEPLRTVAAAYGVSHETIRRIMIHVQKQREQQEA
jgi:hypothetical protein